MADKVIVSREKLVSIANAVREKTGGTESLTLDEMPVSIAGVGGAVGELSQYVKFLAKPESTTVFTIANPLGGIAKKVFVRRTVNTLTSSRKIQEYIADLDFRMGVVYAVSSSGNAKYTATAVDSNANNSEFMIADGVIKLYRFNSANAWDDTNDYEVEIYQ